MTSSKMTTRKDEMKAREEEKAKIPFERTGLTSHRLQQQGVLTPTDDGNVAFMDEDLDDRRSCGYNHGGAI